MRQKWKINFKSHKPRLIITSFEDVLSEIYDVLLKTDSNLL
jgi:hypothetical protein